MEENICFTNDSGHYAESNSGDIDTVAVETDNGNGGGITNGNNDGSDIGNDDSSGGKTRRRRGRRPRSDSAESAVIIDGESVQPIKAKTKSKSIAPEYIAFFLQSTCNTLAASRPWWGKTEDQCMPLAQTVSKCIDSMPKKALETVNKYMLPITLITQTVLFLSVPLSVEFQLLTRKVQHNEPAGTTKNQAADTRKNDTEIDRGNEVTTVFGGGIANTSSLD